MAHNPAAIRNELATRLDNDTDAALSCPDCRLIGYDAAAKEFGPGAARALMQSPTAMPLPSHAAFVLTCAAHRGAKKVLRPWIADIPLYRFKLRLRGKHVFDLDTLRDLLPASHPEYRRGA